MYQHTSNEAGRRGSRGAVAWMLFVAATPLALACGRPEPQAPDAKIRRDTRIVHEPCDLLSQRAESLDVNGDGRADLTRVVDGARELCRGVDLNFDGRIDTWVYRAPDGSIRRRENDFDRDGRIDEIVTYGKDGVASMQHATNLAGRLDTWHYFERGQLLRSERDSDGDAVVDQWWQYPKLPASDCAIIHSDVDGDGRPDPGATVDTCKEEADAAGTMQAEASAGEAGGGPR